LKYLPFQEARKFVHSLGLKSQSQWREYYKSGKKPSNIPSNADAVYKGDWKNWGDWLGTGRMADQHKVFRDFNTARAFIHQINLSNQDEWREYCRSGKKPSDIPANPARRYKKEWKGYGDWLGTGAIASFNKKFKTYSASRDFVRGLGIKSLTQWRKYVKSGKKPDDIPTNPNSYYVKEWKSWGDFLGTGFIAFQDRKYQDFEQARKFVHQLAFKSREDWTKYAMSKSRPQNIPADPSKIFKEGWKGWGDWLGTGTLAPKNKKFLPFLEARIVVQSQHLGSIAKWSEYIKLGNKPDNIPSNPDNYYKSEWKSWGDWLGTGTIAVKDRVYSSFQDAKQFVHKLNLTSQTEWFQYAKGDIKPENVPANPASAYNSEWTSWPDWLGYEEKLWSLNKVKGLLRDLIESKIIYGWDEAVLYSLLCIALAIV
jgi:hypothetical protein